MTKPTGNPPGRPLGARNKRTKAVEAAMHAAAETIAAVVPGAFEGDAHAFLMSVYKNPDFDLSVRIDAAGKAIRYEKPALAAVDVNSTGENITYVVSREPLTMEEWEEQFCREQKPN